MQAPRTASHFESLLLERDRVIQDFSVLLEHERTSTGGQVLRILRSLRAHLCPPRTLRARAYRAASRGVRALSSETSLDFLRLPITNGLRLSKTLRFYAHFRRAAKAKHDLAALTYRPLISVVTPIYNVERRWLQRAIESVTQQSYPHWELCLVDDASTASHITKLLDRYAGHPRIRVRQLEQNVGIAAASNEALALANGDFVALLDHDDELHRDALLEVAKQLNLDPTLDVVYTDEDKLLPTGLRTDPFRKPGWNPDLLLSCNYITHLSVFRRRLLQSIGGFRTGFDGSQDYDLLLRVVEATDRIAHIPKVLYHWRVIPGSTAHSSAAKPKAYSAARRALTEAVSRRGEPAEVGMIRPGIYRQRYAHAARPSLAVLTPHAIDAPADYREMLRLNERCSCELVIPQPEDGELHLSPRVTYASIPVGLSSGAMLNRLARHADRAEFLLFTSGQLRDVSPDWIDALLDHGQRSGVGIVGGKVLDASRRPLHTGYVLDNHARPVLQFCDLYQEGIHKLVYEKVVRNCSAVSADCLLIRRELFESLGGFRDSDLESAAIDLCLRATAQKLRIVYTPFAEVTLSRVPDGQKSQTDSNAATGPSRSNDPYFSPRLLREAVRRAA